jgi:hypothetical protein
MASAHSSPPRWGLFLSLAELGHSQIQGSRSSKREFNGIGGLRVYIRIVPGLPRPAVLSVSYGPGPPTGESRIITTISIARQGPLVFSFAGGPTAWAEVENVQAAIDGSRGIAHRPKRSAPANGVSS